MAFIWYRAGDVLPVGAAAVTNLAQLEIRYLADIESSTVEYPASKKRSRNVPWRLYLGWKKTSFRVTFSERSENVTRFFHNK